MTRHIQVLASASALLAIGAAAPAANAAVSRSCARLPVAISLASTDPTVLQDEPRATVAPARGAAVRSLRVSLRRNGREYASGSLPGRLGRGRTAIALRLTGGRRVGAGRYRLVAAGRSGRCTGRGTVTRWWRFGRPSLPVRAAPQSTLVGDNQGTLRLIVRSVAQRRVAHLRVALLDGSGATVAAGRAGASVRGQSTVDLPLAAGLRPGRYMLRLTGRPDGSSRTQASEQRLAFAAGSSGAAAAAGQPQTGLTRQHAVVEWSGGAWQGREVAGFVAPGVGYGEVVCRPDAQWLRFYPADGGREVAMMNWTYRDWSENQEKALREALHTGYTGPDFLEGLNKFSPPEKRSTGEFDGIVTDRGPFGAVGGASLAPPTTLKLTWAWDFGDPAHARCHVEATVTSEASSGQAPLARSASVVWRGDGNAAGRDSSAVDVPGLGQLRLVCQPGPTGTRTLTVDTPQGAAVTTREGSDDPTRPQEIGPVITALPNNGMVAISFAGGATLLASSRWKANDPDPAQNWCLVAAQVVVP